MSTRLGPYAVESELAHAGPIVLADARDSAGTRVLLQSVTLRPVTDDERPARLAFEKSVATETAQNLLDSPEVRLRAHGGSDGPGGTRILFWALEWPTGKLLGSERPTLTPRELIDIGISLARRLARRHALGRCEPWLCPELLILLPGASADIAGVAVGLDAEWLTPGTPRFALAPEETNSGTPAPPGDVFRLGHVLLELAGQMEPPSGWVRTRLDWLACADPVARVPTAAVAISCLSEASLGLHEAEAGTERPLPFAPLKTEAPPTEIFESGPGSAQENVTEALRLPELAGRTPSDLHVPAGSGNADPFGTEPTVEIHHDPNRDHTLEDQMAEADPDPSEATTRQERFLRPSSAPGKVAAIEVAAAAWEAPILPVGSSPWSEIITARGMQKRAYGDFTGFAEELPGVRADSLGPRGLRTAPAAIPLAPMVSLEIDPEIGAARSGFNARKVTAGIVALLLVFGFFLMVSRPEPEPIAALTNVVIVSQNQVRLDSDPAAATVIAEADGQVLGRTPLEFMIPVGADDSVILLASGYEPQRLLLPERGQIKASLVPLSPGLRCEIELFATRGEAIEGVGIRLSAGARQTIDGAAVVRAAPSGGSAGARIVRCPSLGGAAVQKVNLERRWSPALLNVTHPAGAMVYLDDSPAGRIPLSRRTPGSFTRVRIEDADGRVLERWVPTRTDTELQLPAPSGDVDETGSDRETSIPSNRKPELTEDTQRPAVAMTEPAGIGTPPPRPRVSASSKQLLQKGSRELLAGNLVQARATLVECVQHDPDSAECHRVLGTLYRQTRAGRQARRHFARYLELRPDAADAREIRRLIASLGEEK